MTALLTGSQQTCNRRRCHSTNLLRTDDDIVCLDCGAVHRIALSSVVDGRLVWVGYVGAACRVPKG